MNKKQLIYLSLPLVLTNGLQRNSYCFSLTPVLRFFIFPTLVDWSRATAKFYFDDFKLRTQDYRLRASDLLKYHLSSTIAKLFFTGIHKGLYFRMFA
ncbi:hypothetical protein HDF22_001119 [Mucilaginibacter lappiensis]|uniref:Uncharacterized protein n=1 Tax=Mucilaginibacter lappiensis TaxID=354630 RepID=A0A841J7I2_9SPHI|nr:hypothetical protein [Mucilaginibacter lappiensis]